MIPIRRAALLARSLAVQMWRGMAADIGFWTAGANAESCVRATIKGAAPQTDRVCIFVHYDSGLVVRPHVRRYLDALLAEGFSIVFVSNSPVASDSLDHLRLRCISILMRENRGYDFAAYRDGILSLPVPPEGLAMLLLANDSVYAPIVPLTNLINGMDFTAADVWSATDSWQHRYHLQSYLIGFGPTALAHPQFLAFWRRVRNARSKWAVVKYYEIGLTAVMQAAGLRCAAFFDYQSLMRLATAIMDDQDNPAANTMTVLYRSSAKRALRSAARRQAVNPVIDLWLLLVEAGGPFVKRELLRDDPTVVPDLFAWHRLMRDRAPELYQEVLTDLKRVMRRAAP